MSRFFGFALVVCGLVFGGFWACSKDDSDAGDAGVSDSAAIDSASDDVAVVDAARDGGLVGDGGFVHPGVLVDRAQLDFVKSHIASDPWKTALANVQSHRFVASTYVASPVANVKCDPYSNDPDSGLPEVACSNQVNDAVASYSDALMWAYTSDSRYAAQGIAILNAWSSTLTQMTASNAPLQAAWVAAQLTRAAEIFRYTNAGWKAADIAAFHTMIDQVFLPLIIKGSPAANGNWELAMADAVINIGIFDDDHATFDQGIALWRGRVPAYIYMTGDTATGLPIPPPGGDYNSPSSLAAFWSGQAAPVDGECQETCRDFAHVQEGFASMVNAAETARIQGIDLYGEQKARIIAGYEFHTKYINGATAPKSICDGGPTLATVPTWEIGYNQYANRDGVALPNTKTLVLKQRPTGIALQMAWETLTHAETGSAGDP